VESVKPLCIDLFCGLGGWAEGALAEGYNVIGFDIERHRYKKTVSFDNGHQKTPSGINKGKLWKDRFATGPRDTCIKTMEFTDEWQEYPGQLVIQDVLTLHGRQFNGAALIVASPPCQEFSYMAMPWSRGKQIESALLGKGEFPPGYTGSRTVAELTTLFDACFRIQREASEAVGHHIPMVVENVRGAQKWVGRSKWNYGSFHLWGDVPALMPETIKKFHKVPGFRFDGSGKSFQTAAVEGCKGVPHTPIGHWTNPNENGIKQHGISGPRDNGKGDAWFQDGAARHGSKSNARKAASAMIAKIPIGLSRHIARVYAR